MIFAEVTIDGDPFTYLRDALVLLLLVGGALFLLTTVVLGQESISSGQSRRATLTAKEDDLLGAASPMQRPLPQQPRVNREHRERPDKRRTPRRGGDPVRILVSDGLASAQPVEGLVLNRSRGGLCLSVPHKVEVGQELAVRTPDFPPQLASVHIRVRHCKQTSDGWRIGCQFLEELPWSIVLMFG